MPSDRPNIILIGVDTLRADHLGCYGYHRQTSPTIDRLAGEGTLAERFFCAGLPTHPSFTTLHTGQHPITHGVVAHGGRNEPAKDAPFLSELLLQGGYTTCAVDNLLQHKPWFARGFEYYINPGLRHVLSLDVSCEELNARAIPWLRQHQDEEFFLFIHYWDPHWPLTPPPKYQDLFYQGNPTDPTNHSLDPWLRDSLGQMAMETWLRRPEGRVTDAGYLEALYDQEVRHLDDGIAELLEAVDDLGLADDTLIILLGDHGESITEHGIYLEHRGLYDATLHVPLIVRWPGQIPAGRRIRAMYQHQDIAPTILEAVGLDVPWEMDGESFWTALQGAEEAGRNRVVSCECTWEAKWSLRTETHKIIVSRAPDPFGGRPKELYDLRTDPGEATNLIDRQPDIARQLELELEDWITGKLEDSGKSVDPLVEHGPSINAVEL